MKAEELIEKVKAGDTNALQKMYETYSPIMRGVCVKITQEDEDTINDLVQDAFILAYYSLNTLRDSSKLGEWVSSIAKNVSLRYLDKKQKIRFISTSYFMDEELEIKDTISADSLLNKNEILKIISKLPSGYGKVFKMSAIEGYSHKEIAEKLGIESHSSSSQLARAKSLLRKMMQALTVFTFFLMSIFLCKDLFKQKDTNSKKDTIAPTKGANIRTERIQKEAHSPHLSINPYEPTSIMPNYIIHPCKKTMDSTDVLVSLEKKDSINNAIVSIVSKDSIFFDTIINNIYEIKKNLGEQKTLKHKRKWQLLAIGSLGSTLAYNTYQLIGSNKNDSPIYGDPTPITPSVITTWEDYHKYLLQNIHEEPTTEMLALMNIAEHNNGKIIEHEHHDKPITFGLSLAKSFNNRWCIETGVQYSLLKSHFTLGEGEYYINKVQKTHYLGIPLHISYEWMNYKQLSSYGAIEGVLNIPLLGKTDEYYVTGAIVSYENRRYFSPPFQCTVGIGVGVQYRFTPNWSIYIEPTFNWHIPNRSSIHTIWTSRPFVVTSPFGIRFTW